MCVNLLHDPSDKNPKPGFASLWISSLNPGGCLKSWILKLPMIQAGEAEAGWSLELAYSLGSQISDSFSKTK